MGFQPDQKYFSKHTFTTSGKYFAGARRFQGVNHAKIETITDVVTCLLVAQIFA